MSDIQAVTVTGENTTVAEAGVEEFKSSLRGDVLSSGDVEYEDARKVFMG